MGKDIGGGDRLQKAEPDHWRGNPRAEHGTFGQRAVAEVCGGVAGAAQGGGLASVECDLEVLVLHLQLVFRGDAGGREILQLAAVVRVQRGADIVADRFQPWRHRARHRDAQEHGC